MKYVSLLVATALSWLLVSYPLPVMASAQDDLRAGYAAAKLGDAKTAIRRLNRAIASGRLRDRELVMAYALRGDSHARRKNFGKALADYTQAIRLAADSRVPRAQKARLYADRGLLYQRKGNYQRAIKDYNRALKYNPAFATAYYRRGNAWRLERRFQKAVADYTTALRYRRHHKYYYHRSQAYARLGRLDLAVRDMQEALKLRPGSRQYRSRLGYLESLLKR